ncbi:MotE family protein [Salipiger abyssi]|uniref:MotE family protein n=1 Tax=Salipiger abyssi TaxID=1250539 RepID=UPI0040582E7D
MRPITLLLAGFAVASAAKIGVTLLEDPQLVTMSGQDAPEQTAFVSAASAATSAEPEAPAAPAPVAKEPEVCEAPEDLLASIRQERDLLDAQKERNAQRSAELDLAAETLAVEQQRLADLKAELEGLLEKVEAAHTADVDRLVSLYRNMKPKDAAAIMNDLDIEVSVMVLGTMNERDAAPILAALNPVRARAISQIILERSKLPGDQRLDDIRL